mgnify:CR=1 FL=1
MQFLKIKEINKKYLQIRLQDDIIYHPTGEILYIQKGYEILFLMV